MQRKILATTVVVTAGFFVSRLAQNAHRQKNLANKPKKEDVPLEYQDTWESHSYSHTGLIFDSNKNEFVPWEDPFSSSKSYKKL